MGAKDAMVQNFGGENEFLIRVEKASDDLETTSKIDSGLPAGAIQR